MNVMAWQTWQGAHEKWLWPCMFSLEFCGQPHARYASNEITGFKYYVSSNYSDIDVFFSTSAAAGTFTCFLIWQIWWSNIEIQPNPFIKYLAIMHFPDVWSTVILPLDKVYSILSMFLAGPFRYLISRDGCIDISQLANSLQRQSTVFFFLVFNWQILHGILSDFIFQLADSIKFPQLTNFVSKPFIFVDKLLRLLILLTVEQLLDFT